MYSVLQLETIPSLTASLFRYTPSSSFLLTHPTLLTRHHSYLQSSADFNATAFDVFNATESFGLVDKSSGRWQNLTECAVPPHPLETPSPTLIFFCSSYVAKLNAEADENTAYKVIYIARHGQGYRSFLIHRPFASFPPFRLPNPPSPPDGNLDNAAETAYGKSAWDCFWARPSVLLFYRRIILFLTLCASLTDFPPKFQTQSLQNGDGNSSWADAELTPLGIEQAQENNAAWKTQIEEGVPLPQKLYSSPMRRSAKTLDITWCVSLSLLLFPFLLRKLTHRLLDVCLGQVRHSPQRGRLQAIRRGKI